MYTTPFTPAVLASRTPRSTLALAGMLLITLTLYQWTRALPLAPLAPNAAAHNLAFVPNHGQATPEVRMQAYANRTTLSFAESGVALNMPDATLQVRFEGANTHPAIVGGAQLPEVVNYLIGSDPSAWHTGLPIYAALTYHELYQGINLRYDGPDGHLKGTYLVAPGADPTQIRWRYEGAAGVNVAATTGDLQIVLPNGNALTEQAPIAWQEQNGQRVPVAVRYLLNNESISFALGTYNAALPLTIDPTLIFSSYLGGGRIETARAVATDPQGNAYITGDSDSNDFPLLNPYQDENASPGNRELFVTKVGPTGVRIYSTYIGGNGSDSGFGIAVDAEGNAYVTGQTSSSNFPVKAAFQDEPGGSTDSFVLKLNPAGSDLVFSSYLGGTASENGSIAKVGLVLDANNNLFVSGITGSPALATAGAFQQQRGGDADAFVAKIAAAGNELLFFTYLGGAGADENATDLAMAPDGSVYVTGYTNSDNFPVQNAFQPTIGARGNRDGFVSRLSADGVALTFSSYLGGAGTDQGQGIAANADGVNITGFTVNSADFPTKGNQSLLGAPGSAFLTRVNAQGAMVFSARFGGVGRAYGSDIALDAEGSVYITGAAESENFPVKNPVQNMPAGKADAYVIRLDPQGCSVAAGTYLGGSEDENAASNLGSVAVDNQGNAYIVGATASSDFRLQNAQQTTLGGTGDAFVAKLDMSGEAVCNSYYLPLVIKQ